MTIPGPQIGGVSLFIHILVIGVVRVVQLIKRVYTISTKLFQKSFRPFLPNAK